MLHTILGAHAGFFGKIDGLLAEAMKVDEKQPEHVAEIERKIALLQMEANQIVASLFAGASVIPQMQFVYAEGGRVVGTTLEQLQEHLAKPAKQEATS